MWQFSATGPTVKLDGYYGPLPRRLVVMEDPKPDSLADDFLKQHH